jgi:hypothetical protein
VYFLFILYMFDNTRYKNQNCIILWQSYGTTVVHTVRSWLKRRYATHTCIKKACGYLHAFFLQIEFAIGKHFTSIVHCLHRTGSIQLGWWWINNVNLNFICRHNLLRTASYQLFCFCRQLCEVSVRIAFFCCSISWLQCGKYAGWRENTVQHWTEFKESIGYWHLLHYPAGLNLCIL